MKQRFSKRTRLVSALLTLAMVFTFLPFSAFAATDSDDSGYVENTNTFPDEAFWSYLLKYVDKNRNGTLSQEERYAVETINVNLMNIRSLKGIEFFPNLTELYCVGNQLTELDMSQNKELQTLDCVANQLTELDVSQNKKLKELHCSANQLTELDVRSNTALERLSCQENQLTELDVRNNTALMKLYCGKNQLTELDLSQNSKLKDLDCRNNQLTSLNVDSCAEFIDLGCGGNEYPVKVSAQTRTFDLHKLPGGFDPSRASDWEGGTVSNGILTVDSGATEVTYSYDCGRGKTRRFALRVLTMIEQVNLRVNTPKKGEMPDETVIILDNGADVCDVKIRWGMGDIGGEPIPGSFQTGKRYTLQVGLYAKPGYKFSEDTVCTVNGQEAKFFMTMKDDTEYYATRSFVLSLNPGGFEHDHKMEMTHDEHSHWMECPICHTVQDTEAHVYDDDKDTTCNVCGYVRSLTPEKPDPGTTPGGGTGTTTPPSGGGTGTTTPPSGGEGTGTTTPPSGGGTGTVTPPSGGDGTGTTTPPSGGDGGGGAVIIMAAGAAVAGVVGYGVYNYVSGQKLQALLPEGVAAPENRAQTALLLWNTAGRPEPAEAPAFADVADPDTAKAAQWCVEQGLMKRRLNGKFAPGSSIPAYQVLNAYRKLAG